MKWCFLCLLILVSSKALAAQKPVVVEKPVIKSAPTLKEKLQTLSLKNSRTAAASNTLIFDLPVTYNKKVSTWVHYYQSKGQKWFREWLARSSKYMPFIQAELQRAGLPTDLAFMVMIESGFSSRAVSHADAVGPWQFIAPTGTRYGLRNNWWLDERRDLKKSTLAAIRYLKDLREEFGSWYLVAASYNMGEAGLRRQIKKHGTKDYWTLVQKGALPAETQEYVPKILAAMLITKAPNLYGFRGVEQMDVLDYEVVSVPGGTDLDAVADHLGLTRKALKDLNAEILLGYIPRQVDNHFIRVPKGASNLVSKYVNR
jgi:membrane-bound lytic murein transglycosylase D